MLTIQNIKSIKQKPFTTSDGSEWLYYGVSVYQDRYNFTLIPMEAGRWDSQKSVLINLYRNRSQNGMGLYEIENKKLGVSAFILLDDLKHWSTLMQAIVTNKLI